VAFVDPTLITVARWGQLDEGVLRCPRGSRRMQGLATLVDPVVVRKILEHLGVRASPLPRAPPRDKCEGLGVS
jgi:hypothetical protein